MSAVAFHDVRKAFGAVQALRGVSFTVAPGEAHAIVGENGAGKSTLLKILAGITRPDAGEIRLNDAPFECAGPRDALAAGVGLVFQERLAFPNLTVAGNIFAGRELTRRGGRLDDNAMRARTVNLLAGLHVPVAPDRLMADVSAAHAQLVQVARALAFDCRVLVLDEPTTSLTDAEVDHLFQVLIALRERGVTLIFVSHRLPEVFRLCDRITVLRDGSYVDTFERSSTTTSDVVRAMVGRDAPTRASRVPADRLGPPALSARGLSRRGAFRDVSLDVWPGEIVGVFGLVGSGRSELLRVLFGLDTPDAGRILVDGRDRQFRSVRDAGRAGLALVPEDRQQFGLHANLCLRDNLALPSAARAGLGRIDRAREAARGASLLAALAIRAGSLDQPPDALSGGNQQKLVAARWLATEPRVLLLDEPTKGVDVGAKFEIHELVRAQARGGTACLVVSSDLPEVLALSDRVLVMRAGSLVGELAADEATEAAVMHLATHDAAVSA